MADEKEVEYDLARRYRRAKLREGATSALQAVYGRDAFSNRIKGDPREAASDSIVLGNIDRARKDAAAAARKAMSETDPELKKVALQEYGKLLKQLGEMLVSHSNNTATGSAQKMATVGAGLLKMGEVVYKDAGGATGDIANKASVIVSELRQGTLTGSATMGADGTSVEGFVEKLRNTSPEDRAVLISEMRRLDNSGEVATLLDSGLSGSSDDDVYLNEVRALVAEGANAAEYTHSQATSAMQMSQPFVNDARQLSAGGDNIDKMLDAFNAASAPLMQQLGSIIDGPDPNSITAGGSLDSTLPSTGVDVDEQAALDKARALRDQIGKKHSEVLREALERRPGFSTALGTAQSGSTAPLNTDKFFREYVRDSVRDRIAPGSSTLPGVVPARIPEVAPLVPPVRAPMAPSTTSPQDESDLERTSPRSL